MTSHCDIVVFGGCVVDSIHRPESSTLRATTMHGTSNRCTLTTSFGGVGRNVTEACARMGLDVALVSAVGDDIVGRAIVRALEELARAGIQKQHSSSSRCGEVSVADVKFLRGHVTASYTAILDGSGELCVASAVMAILDQCLLADQLLIPSSRVASALQTTATWFVLEGNVPKEELNKAATFARQCSRMSTVRGSRRLPLLIAYDPISSSKAERAVDALQWFDLMKPNLTEVIVFGKLLGVIDEASANVALRLAEEIDAVAGGDGKQGGIVEQWLHAVKATSASPCVTTLGNTIGGMHAVLGTNTTLAAAATQTTSFAQVLAKTLESVTHKLLEKFPGLVVLCTLGRLGCVVGVGQQSFLRSMQNATAVSDEGKIGSVPTVLCFPPPDVPRAAIRKVTGAGDSFLSGFIVATTRLLKQSQLQQQTQQQQQQHNSASARHNVLDAMIRSANEAAAAALTSHVTISPQLCSELVDRAILQSAVVSSKL